MYRRRYLRRALSFGRQLLLTWIYFSEKSGKFYQTSRRNIQEYSTFIFYTKLGNNNSEQRQYISGNNLLRIPSRMTLCL
jgi:hypothetical protein